MPNHEFPQPYDLVVRETSAVQPRPPEQVVFLQRSTSLMVGQIPVQLGKPASSSYTHRPQILKYHLAIYILN